MLTLSVRALSLPTEMTSQGSTFTVIGPETVLESFSFSVNEDKYLRIWTPLSSLVMSVRSGHFCRESFIGPVLYESGLTTVGYQPALQKITFNTGGVPLTNGQVYVAFIERLGIH